MADRGEVAAAGEDGEFIEGRFFVRRPELLCSDFFRQPLGAGAGGFDGRFIEIGPRPEANGVGGIAYLDVADRGDFWRKPRCGVKRQLQIGPTRFFVFRIGDEQSLIALQILGSN